MEIIFAKKLGFCSGVRRAISLAQSTLAGHLEKGNKSSRVYTLGPLIHNPQEVKRLETLGVRAISNLKNIGKGILIIPSHGLAQSILKKVARRGIKFVDTTCPFVKRAQVLAKKLHKRGCHVVIVGQKTHPEVVSLVSFANEKASVVESLEDLQRLQVKKKIGVISQTTQPLENFEKIVNKLKSEREEVEIYNTICKESSGRQKEARSLAEKSDVVIVVGGRNSANTTRLYNISRKVTETYHIEDPEELRSNWFKDRKVVGLTAGTSTPDWVIRKVVRTLLEIRPS